MYKTGAIKYNSVNTMGLTVLILFKLKFKVFVVIVCKHNAG